jgi:hypothetical protein
MDKDGCLVVYLQLESVESVGISGISWNWVVTERQAVKGTTEQGRRNRQQNLYHHKKIIEQYGQVNMTSE